jgi:uncharacterized protein YecE (DUF72 family)
MDQRSDYSAKQEARPGTALVGCAGWSIPGPQAGRFPAEGSHLERYAQLFGAVEINSSFYRPHRVQTYARWAASVPEGFRFSVKMPKLISHELRLAGIDEALARFVSEVTALEQHLGCVLIQLPGSDAFEAARASAAFALIRRHFTCMLACEARHPSWFDNEATKVLLEHAITRVIADPPKGQPGEHVPTTADTYTRLHGGPRVYYSSYEDDAIAAMAEGLRSKGQAGDSNWVIFDNTASGAAMANALQLRYR